MYSCVHRSPGWPQAVWAKPDSRVQVLGYSLGDMCLSPSLNQQLLGHVNCFLCSILKFRLRAEIILGTFFSWRITASPNPTRHSRPQLAASLLTFRWPKGITWPSPTPVMQEEEVCPGHSKRWGESLFR